MAGRSTVFDAFLAGEKAARVPVVPILSGLAARVGGFSTRDMTSDSGAWTVSLTKAAALFRPDAVIVGFDPVLSVEAIGGEVAWNNDIAHLSRPPASLPAAYARDGRLAAAIETAGRLFSTMAGGPGCVAAMTGPLTLASQAFGAEHAVARVAELKSVQVQIAEAYCKTRPDVLMLVEGRALGGASIGPAQRRAFNTIRNVAHHFNVATALYLEDYTPDAVASLGLLGLDFYLFGGAADNSCISAGEGLADAARGIGLPVIGPDGSLSACPTPPQSSANLLHTSAGALGAEVDIQALRQTMNALMGITS